MAIGKTQTEFIEQSKKIFGSKGSNFNYYWLKRNGFPAGYQVLCYNCNMAKGFYGTCPHEGVV